MYDKSNRLIPKDVKSRAKVREWMAAAEGTFMVHALAVCSLPALALTFRGRSPLSLPRRRSGSGSLPRAFVHPAERYLTRPVSELSSQH